MTSSYLRTGMNTGLGDYIHLKKENYLRYGFFRSGGSSSQSFAVSTACAYRDIRNLMIAKVQRNGNTRLLEILLTDFYRQNLSSDNAYAQWAGVNTQNIAQQEQSLVEAVEEKMPQYFVFNRDAMTVENPSAFKSKVEKMYKLKDGQQKISINSLKKIYTRLRQTQTYLTRILNTGNVKNVAEVAKRMEEVKIYRKVVNAAIKELKLTHSVYQSTEAHGIPFILRQLENLDIAIKQPTTTQIGTTGEIGVLAGLFVLNNKIDFTAEELLAGLKGEKSAGHSQRSSIYASFDLGNGKTSHINATQDTVDIQFKASNSILFGNRTSTIGASVKNYESVSAGVKIISGVTLETILGLTGSAFANHYLNRVASHEDGIVPIPESANNVIKYALAVRGITGMRNRLFGKLSNYLIIIEEVAKRVRVYDSYEILQRLASHPEKFNEDLVNITGFPIAAGSIANKKIGSTPDPALSKQRITSIMNEVRKKKLTMSLSANFFQ